MSVCLSVCLKRQEERNSAVEPKDMDGETLVAMVNKAVNMIMTRIQSERRHPLCPQWCALLCDIFCRLELSSGNCFPSLPLFLSYIQHC